MAKKRYYSDSKDSGMIKEDYSAPSNLPRNVVYREYPKIDYDYYDLNDDIKGVDNQMRDDTRGAARKKGKYPTKY